MDSLERRVRSLLVNRTTEFNFASAVEVVDFIEQRYFTSRSSLLDYQLLFLDTAGLLTSYFLCPFSIILLSNKFPHF